MMVCWLWMGSLSAALGGEITDAQGTVVSVDEPARIVSLGGNLTETLFALGLGDRVVGVDASSLYPAGVESLPQVGYYRAVSTEGVVSLGPELIVASEDVGPPPAVGQLQGMGVPMVILESEPTAAGARTRITQLGELLDREEAAAQLVADMDAELAKVPRPSGKPLKVLFLYARGGGTLNISGTGTAADGIIELAGATNAVQGYEGYKPATTEALVAAAPDVILLTTRGLESMGGKDALLSHPGLALTPAGKAGRVIAMDDLLLLGFGPRTGEAAATLARELGSPR